GNKISNPPWVKFQSAGWVNFPSAPTISGLKASVMYLSGDNVDSAQGERNEWERDLRLDYVLQEGSLKGLGFSLRNASLRGNVGADVDENRLYVTYSLPLL
ncbi:OprD family outer membrane porin, partial [Ectopseudomonas oleovorans]